MMFSRFVLESERLFLATKCFMNQDLLTDFALEQFEREDSNSQNLVESYICTFPLVIFGKTCLVLPLWCHCDPSIKQEEKCLFSVRVQKGASQLRRWRLFADKKVK